MTTSPASARALKKFTDSATSPIEEGHAKIAIIERRFVLEQEPDMGPTTAMDGKHCLKRLSHAFVSTVPIPSKITWSSYIIPDHMEIDRDNDNVYEKVLAVVKSITTLSRTLPKCPSEQCVDLVKV